MSKQPDSIKPCRLKHNVAELVVQRLKVLVEGGSGLCLDLWPHTACHLPLFISSKITDYWIEFQGTWVRGGAGAKEEPFHFW